MTDPARAAVLIPSRALARRLSPHVLEVEGADHSMFVSGPSGAVFGRIGGAVERFLDEVVWP